jgi:hypothetical protein
MIPSELSLSQGWHRTRCGRKMCWPIRSQPRTQGRRRKWGDKHSAGAVANGRCQDFTLVAPGAVPGESVVVSLRATAPPGLLFYGERVPLANKVTMKICICQAQHHPQSTPSPFACSLLAD